MMVILNGLELILMSIEIQHGIASADMNGNGYIDVATSPGLNGNFFSIWLNNGDGTYSWDEELLSNVRNEILPLLVLIWLIWIMMEKQKLLWGQSIRSQSLINFDS